MTKKQIQQHSNYHAFKIERESDKVVLRAKRFLFSKTWLPESGLKLLKDIAENSIPLSEIAPFRVENLNLHQVYQDLNKFYMTMDLEKRMRVQSSYDRLRKKIESMPAMATSFPKLNIPDLKSQDIETLEPVIPDHFAHLVDVIENESIPELQGETFPEDINEAEFTSECVKGLDVCVYTASAESRPWVGRLGVPSNINLTN